MLGASETRLVYLLSEAFIRLLAVATVVAIPVTYLLCGEIIFGKYAADMTQRMPEFAMSVAGVLCMSLVMIGVQAVKVARANPSETLKQE